MATNQAIRTVAKENGVKLWQVADALGVTDSTFSRKLRHELPREEQQRILAVILEVHDGKAGS